MSERRKSFWERKQIKISEVMYITRNGRKTVINLNDGSKIETFNPIKSILQNCPQDTFVIINKGVVISAKYVERIDDNEYYMVDGAKFTGRVRATKNQKYNIAQNINNKGKGKWERFAEFENFPIAFCIIELVFNKNGHGIDFIFRYCNPEMENLEGKSIDEMIDKSFYEVFENGDKKWLITYADVALNGGKKVIESYSPEIDANLRIYCYQPKPNFCACFLIKI